MANSQAEDPSPEVETPQKSSMIVKYYDKKKIRIRECQYCSNPENAAILPSFGKRKTMEQDYSVIYKFVAYTKCRHVLNINFTEKELQNGIYIDGYVRNGKDFLPVRNVGPLISVEISSNDPFKAIALCSNLKRYVLLDPMYINYGLQMTIQHEEALVNTVFLAILTHCNENTPLCDFVHTIVNQCPSITESMLRRNVECLRRNILVMQLKHMDIAYDRFVCIRDFFKYMHQSENNPRNKPIEQIKAVTTPLIETLFSNIFNAHMKKTNVSSSSKNSNVNSSRKKTNKQSTSKEANNMPSTSKKANSKSSTNKEANNNSSKSKEINNKPSTSKEANNNSSKGKKTNNNLSTSKEANNMPNTSKNANSKSSTNKEANNNSSKSKETNNKPSTIKEANNMPSMSKRANSKPNTNETNNKPSTSKETNNKPSTSNETNNKPSTSKEAKNKSSTTIKAKNKTSKETIKKESMEKKTEVIFNSSPKVIWRGDSLTHVSNQNKIYYKQVELKLKSSINIEIGDFVIYKPEVDESSIILRVWSMWYDKVSKENKFHGHLYIRSHQTILGDVGDVKELFKIKRCYPSCSIPLIRAVIRVVRSHQIETGFDFYYSKCYGDRLCRFEEIDNNMTTDGICISCPLCAKRKQLLMYYVPHLKDLLPDDKQALTCINLYMWNSMTYCGRKYQVGSGVFLNTSVLRMKYFGSDKKEPYTRKNPNIYPEDHRKKNAIKRKDCTYIPPFHVGYIESIVSKGYAILMPRDIFVYVFMMMRPQNIRRDYESDLSLLYWTDRYVKVSIEDLIDPCELSYVKNITSPINEWCSKSTNRFYFKNAYNHKTKKVYEVPNEFQEIGRSLEMIDKVELMPLRSLDLFSGCGGLSHGLNESGFTRSIWAIESDRQAAKAFQLNHPLCKVFNLDANEMLQSIINGSEDASLRDFPKRGEVDVICCGPPCQGFSMMNQYTNSECSQLKNSLIATTMSYCDHLRPKYFIFENVRNFVSYGKGLLLKTVLYSLIRMGYQCAFKVLQAGNYGVPQARRRVIIFGAAEGSPLSHFPDPTFTFSNKSSLNVGIGDRFCFAFYQRKTGPYRAMTIKDAISDLPAIENGFDCTEVEYVSPALTTFQAKMRKNSTVVSDHICVNLTDLNITRVRLIPIKSGADWRDLPNIEITLENGKKLKVLEYKYKYKDGTAKICSCQNSRQCSKEERQTETLIPYYLPHTADVNSNWVGVLGRLSWYGYFKTVLTYPNILGKQGKVIHPDQHRTVSVRECARSQGFPDDFIFEGNIRHKYRQIGNAVPPPLAYAIGKSIVEAMRNYKEPDP